MGKVDKAKMVEVHPGLFKTASKVARRSFGVDKNVVEKIKEKVTDLKIKKVKPKGQFFKPDLRPKVRKSLLLRAVQEEQKNSENDVISSTPHPSRKEHMFFNSCSILLSPINTRKESKLVPPTSSNADLCNKQSSSSSGSELLLQHSKKSADAHPDNHHKSWNDSSVIYVGTEKGPNVSPKKEKVTPKPERSKPLGGSISKQSETKNNSPSGCRYRTRSMDKKELVNSPKNISGPRTRSNSRTNKSKSEGSDEEANRTKYNNRTSSNQRSRSMKNNDDSIIQNKTNLGNLEETGKDREYSEKDANKTNLSGTHNEVLQPQAEDKFDNASHEFVQKKQDMRSSFSEKKGTTSKIPVAKSNHVPQKDHHFKEMPNNRNISKKPELVNISVNTSTVQVQVNEELQAHHKQPLITVETQTSFNNVRLLNKSRPSQVWCKPPDRTNISIASVGLSPIVVLPPKEQPNALEKTLSETLVQPVDEPVLETEELLVEQVEEPSMEKTLETVEKTPDKLSSSIEQLQGQEVTQDQSNSANIQLIIGEIKAKKNERSSKKKPIEQAKKTITEIISRKQNLSSSNSRRSEISSSWEVYSPILDQHFNNNFQRLSSNKHNIYESLEEGNELDHIDFSDSNEPSLPGLHSAWRFTNGNTCESLDNIKLNFIRSEHEIHCSVENQDNNELNVSTRTTRKLSKTRVSKKLRNNDSKSETDNIRISSSEEKLLGVRPLSQVGEEKETLNPTSFKEKSLIRKQYPSKTPKAIVPESTRHNDARQPLNLNTTLTSTKTKSPESSYNKTRHQSNETLNEQHNHPQIPLLIVSSPIAAHSKTIIKLMTPKPKKGAKDLEVDDFQEINNSLPSSPINVRSLRSSRTSKNISKSLNQNGNTEETSKKGRSALGSSRTSQNKDDGHLQATSSGKNNIEETSDKGKRSALGSSRTSKNDSTSTQNKDNGNLQATSSGENNIKETSEKGKRSALGSSRTSKNASTLTQNKDNGNLQATSSGENNIEENSEKRRGRSALGSTAPSENTSALTQNRGDGNLPATSSGEKNMKKTPKKRRGRMEKSKDITRIRAEIDITNIIEAPSKTRPQRNRKPPVFLTDIIVPEEWKLDYILKKRAEARRETMIKKNTNETNTNNKKKKQSSKNTKEDIAINHNENEEDGGAPESDIGQNENEPPNVSELSEHVPKKKTQNKSQKKAKTSTRSKKQTKNNRNEDIEENHNEVLDDFVVLEPSINEIQNNTDNVMPTSSTDKEMTPVQSDTEPLATNNDLEQANRDDAKRRKISSDSDNARNNKPSVSRKRGGKRGGSTRTRKSQRNCVQEATESSLIHESQVQNQPELSENAENIEVGSAIDCSPRNIRTGRISRSYRKETATKRRLNTLLTVPSNADTGSTTFRESQAISTIDSTGQNSSKSLVTDENDYTTFNVDGENYKIRYMNRIPSETEYRRVGPLNISESVRDPKNEFSAGYMRILPLQRKPMTTSLKFKLTYVVISGRAEVTCNQQISTAHQGDFFYIHLGQEYSIKNIDSYSDLILVYSRTKERSQF